MADQPISCTGAPTCAPIWQICLDELAGRHPALPLYLAHSTARRNGNQLTIRVLTPWARAWLDTRLRPIVEQTVQQIAGKELQIIFTV